MGKNGNGQKVFCAHSRMVALDKLTEHPANPNTHPPEQIAMLAKIIRQQGWRNAIVVSNRSKLITKGHARLMAAKALGLKSAPVDFQDYADDKSEVADMIADNRIAELAELDRGTLRNLVEMLDDGAFDMDLTGFDTDALEELMTATMPASDIDAEPQIDKAEELRQKWGVERGQIWQIGEHRLMCGDCLTDHVTDSSSICFTSPPYNAGVSSQLSGNTSIDNNFYKDKYDDNRNQGEFLQFLIQFTDSALRVCPNVFVNFQFLAGNKLAFIGWLNYFASRVADIAIWDKGHAAPAAAQRVMDSRFEFIIVFTHQGNRAIGTRDFRGMVQNVLQSPPQRHNDFAASHAATMPVDVARHYIETFSNAKELIYEPFAGTGTTIIACEQTNRKCRAMEIDPGYVAVAIQRWADATGKTPQLL